MKEIKPLRICNHCGYLGTEGYEYPETYCIAGVADDDPLVCMDKHGNMGCIYTNRQLKIMQEYIDEMQTKRYEGFGEWYEEQRRKEQDGLEPLFS